tara:strand:- start:218379 stop:219272 length:894 start_codon:yes stop_codon:yes gene_type:complete
MQYKAGFVGIIGQPNAGKSTLLNALLGEKLAIVTRKPQTTRQRICGIHSSENAQVVFLDAPGVIQSTAGLNKFLQEEYEAVIEESDFLLVVLNVDAKKKEELEVIIDLAKASGKPFGVIISKCDLKFPHRKLWIMSQVSAEAKFVLDVCARNRPQEAQDLVLGELYPYLPDSPAPLYDPELYTTQNMRELASELVREKCFEYLHAEIPYGLAVQVNKYEESPSIDKIYAQIFISKQAHRSMVIGQGGSKLKKIGMTARQDLEKVLGKKVYLDVHVSVKKNWMKNAQVMQELGYVQPS